MRKLTVEFIGTFFLVCGAALAEAQGATLALIIMVYAGGHISGAHFNPAVSVAMLVRRKISMAEFPGYILVQFLAAVVAGLLVAFVFEKQGSSSCAINDGLLKGLLAEFIGTFALAYVVLNVATARGTTGNSFYGLAIGLTVLAMATLFGNYSGGVFNPAVGIGLAIQKSICWNQVWVYFVAPVAGGIVAAYTFLSVNGADEAAESIPDDVEPKKR
jgi:aquaporin Z